MERIPEASAGPRARITGAVYLLFFLTAVFGEFLVSRKLVVYGDTVSLVSDACHIGMTLLFYEMFKPVNRGLSLVAALFSLVGAEGLLMLWLLVRGVNVPRWNEQAGVRPDF
jgi:hypothetical protein